MTVSTRVLWQVPLSRTAPSDERETLILFGHLTSMLTILRRVVVRGVTGTLSDPCFVAAQAKFPSLQDYLSWLRLD